MKFILSMLTFTLLFFVLSSTAMARCYSGDRQVDVRQRVDRISCTTSGYCRAYGRNPATGRYEYYYGHHANCPGVQERTVTVYHCLNSLGVGYTVDRYGYWSACRIR